MIDGWWAAGAKLEGQGEVVHTFVVEEKLLQWLFPDGVTAAENLLRKKVADYDSEFGRTDPETGTREFPGNGAEWYQEMEELADEIAALREKKP